MTKAKHNLLKILGALPLMVTITCLNLAVHDSSANPSSGVSVRTDSQGRVTGLSNLADPTDISGSTCNPQVKARGVISQIKGNSTSSIDGIQFQGIGESRSRHYNITRPLSNTSQIKSFLTSGKQVDITYTATGASCRFLYIKSIQSTETQSQNPISPSQNIGLTTLRSELKTHTDPGRFSIKYPSDWTIKEDGRFADGSFEISSFTDFRDANLPQDMAVGVNFLQDGYSSGSLQKNVNSYLDWINSRRGRVRLITHGKTKIGGRQAYQFWFRNGPGVTYANSVTTYIEYDQNETATIVISYHSSNPSAAELIKTINGSFRILR